MFHARALSKTGPEDGGRGIAADRHCKRRANREDVDHFHRATSPFEHLGAVENTTPLRAGRGSIPIFRRPSFRRPARKNAVATRLTRAAVLAPTDAQIQRRSEVRVSAWLSIGLDMLVEEHLAGWRLPAPTG